MNRMVCVSDAQSRGSVKQNLLKMLEKIERLLKISLKM